MNQKGEQKMLILFKKDELIQNFRLVLFARMQGIWLMDAFLLSGPLLIT